jgi:pyridoxine/pyridoxamine 5'-phosphate oxidase
VTTAALYHFLRAHKLAVLATTASGSPQSALVGIAVTPNLEIVFDTLSNSRKYQNLRTNPACSLVIGWDHEQTLQYEGTAEQLQHPELPHYQAIYFAAHPDGRSRLSSSGISYFLIRPRWLRYSDYNQNPPLIEELSL